MHAHDIALQVMYQTIDLQDEQTWQEVYILPGAGGDNEYAFFCVLSLCLLVCGHVGFFAGQDAMPCCRRSLKAQRTLRCCVAIAIAIVGTASLHRS